MTMSERFWAKVQKADGDGCWLWTAGKVYGYGIFWVAGKNEKAPRVSWEIHFGPIPDGLWVLHSCDTPACVRPSHLFLGTNADNVADKLRKGRGNAARGEMQGHSKLVPDQVLEIRRRRAMGETLASIGSSFSISEAGVSRICSGSTWAHLPLVEAA